MFTLNVKIYLDLSVLCFLFRFIFYILNKKKNLIDIYNCIKWNLLREYNMTFHNYELVDHVNWSQTILESQTAQESLKFRLISPKPSSLSNYE